MSRPPVLILGMHRSGTSLLARVLASEGLFLGHRVQTDHEESYFFQALDEYVLREAGATWDRPEGLAALLDQPAVTDYLVDYLSRSVGGPRSVGFLGWRRWRAVGSPFGLDEPWGWKDPRTTLLVDLWARVFPGARVLHVTRHGVDVARSLQVRTEMFLDHYLDRYRSRRGAHRYLARRAHFSTSLRVVDLDEGMKLWDLYTTAGEQAVKRWGPLGLQVRYEDLLERPGEVLPEVVDFCRLDAAVARRAHRPEFQPSRAWAHRSEPALEQVARRHADLLSRHGYP